MRMWNSNPCKSWKMLRFTLFVYAETKRSQIVASELKICSEYVHLIDMEAQHPQDLCPRLIFLRRHRLRLWEAKLEERE
jgi:hypothetical protein